MEVHIKPSERSKRDILADTENVIFFTQADVFNPKFYPKVRKLRQNQIYIKTDEVCT